MGDIDAAFWVRPFQVMEWSNEASLALINEYKKQPVLWDVRHPSYSFKSQKQEAWETIASNMQLDAQEVKQKMSSLLGSFRREKSRMRKNVQTLGIGGVGYFPKWFAFEKMQFLLRGDDADNAVVKIEEEEDSIFDEIKYTNQEPSTTSAPPIKRPKKVINKPSTDPIIDDFSIFPPQDEYSAFGQYIACKLRKFDPRTRAFVERAINNILFEAEMGKYDNVALNFDTTQQNWESPIHNDTPPNLSCPSPLNDITNSS